MLNLTAYNSFICLCYCWSQNSWQKGD